MARIDYEPHEQLEQRVKEFLAEHNFLTGEATYHQVWQGDLARILQRRYTPTALYIRSRADRVAVHESLEFDFEWEAKTHENKNRNDLTLEALPVAHHLLKSQLGVQCLYVCYHTNLKKDFGFWCDEFPPVRCVMLPSRWRGWRHDWFKSVLNSYWPERLVELDKTRGSGDPFLIIDQSEIEKLEDWRTLILNRAIQTIQTRSDIGLESIGRGLNMSMQSSQRQS